MTKKNSYRPNKFPNRALAFFIITGVALLFYVIFSLMHGELHLPGRYSRGVFLHGAPMWIMAGAFICASAFLLSYYVDHLDERNNEWRYERFRKWTGNVGWILFGASLALHLYFLLTN
jgi:amino acid permease